MTKSILIWSQVLTCTALVYILYEMKDKSHPDFKQRQKQFENIYYRDNIFPGLSNREVVNIGWAHSLYTKPEHSYLNYKMIKPVGTFRIGIFGASEIEGAEAENGYGLSGQLQKLFDEQSTQRVEVINFGVQGYGIHQSYYLWKVLGKKYGLDLVILSYSIKNHDHGHGFCPRTYKDFVTPIHGRYILRGNQLQFIEPIGSNRAEAHDHYHRLIPPWRYLRYDTKWPPGIHLLLPDVAKQFRNFFYYWPLHPNKEKENVALAILKKWSSESNQLLVHCWEKTTCSLSRQLEPLPNIHFLPKFKKTYIGFYSAIMHSTALAYELEAERLFRFVNKDTNKFFNTIKLTSISDQKSFSPEAKPLSEYRSVSFRINSEIAAKLVSRQPRWLVEENAFKKNNIASLIQLPKNSGLKFLPHIRRLSLRSEPLELWLSTGNRKLRVPFGSIEARHPGLGNFIRKPLPKTIQFFPSMDRGNPIGTLQFQNTIDKLSIEGPTGIYMRGIRNKTDPKRFELYPTFPYFSALSLISPEGINLSVKTLTQNNLTLDLVLGEDKVRIPLFKIETKLTELPITNTPSRLLSQPNA